MEINFTIRSHEIETDWSLSIDELENKYWHDRKTLPDDDATVVYCTFADTPLYFETFKDLVSIFIGA